MPRFSTTDGSLNPALFPAGKGVRDHHTGIT
jgi:hypothetical protein